MQEFTPEGLRVLDEVARRHGVSRDAAAELLRALAQGGGAQAQFNHPDLGGMGQWSQGGMIMVGDMFNQGLKHRVDTLCNELAGLLRSQPLFAPEPAQRQAQSQGGGVSLFMSGTASSPGRWWPAELGAPSSTGAQNDLRYAFFPPSRRLAIEAGGKISVFDTGDHQLSGFSQQQSGDQSLTFTSQHGLVRVADLPRLPFTEEARESAAPVEPAASPAPAPAFPQGVPPATAPVKAPEPAPVRTQSTDDILTTIERLAELRQKNILSEEEFAAKKADLLSRL